MIKFSTGLRNGLLVTGALRTLLNGGSIKIYSGAVPASADAEIGAGNTLLVEIKTDVGGGLTLESAAADGVVTKTLAEIWQGTAANTGTATFFRHVTASDTGASSTTQARIQGQVGVVGQDMNLSSVNLTAGAIQKIDYYSVSLLES